MSGVLKQVLIAITDNQTKILHIKLGAICILITLNRLSISSLNKFIQCELLKFLSLILSYFILVYISILYTVQKKIHKLENLIHFHSLF